MYVASDEFIKIQESKSFKIETPVANNQCGKTYKGQLEKHQKLIAKFYEMEVLNSDSKGLLVSPAPGSGSRSITSVVMSALSDPISSLSS